MNKSPVLSPVVAVEQKQDRQVQHPFGGVPFFPWPTSRPGPRATPPPAGELPLRSRSDQMRVVGYDQETGHSRPAPSNAV